jgi:predicted DNA-binding transcriptional regulator AlpA
METTTRSTTMSITTTLDIDPSLPGDATTICRWVGTRELAARLAVQPATIRAWARQGLIPAGRRIGKFLRWDLSEIESFMDSKSD